MRNAVTGRKKMPPSHSATDRPPAPTRADDSMIETAPASTRMMQVPRHQAAPDRLVFYRMGDFYELLERRPGVPQAARHPDPARQIGR